MEQTIASARLGTFGYDPALEWFEAETDFSGSAVTLNLVAETPDAAAPLMANAEAMVADETQWLARLQQCAAGLTDIANEWNDGQDDWDGPIDEAGFVARITLKSISFHENGAFQAYFGDGDLFWGHTIIVRGTMTDGPQEASTAG
jgi:hypothetical protein